jgi:hypothetical protein
MADEEIYNIRDNAYSAWHRSKSIVRFTKSMDAAKSMMMIDCDAAMYIEADESKTPIAFFELAMDVGQDYKCATIIKNCARDSRNPVGAFIVLYTLSDTANPADNTQQDIQRFRAKRIWPNNKPAGWRIFTPQQWADQLQDIRDRYKIDKEAQDSCPF